MGLIHLNVKLYWSCNREDENVLFRYSDDDWSWILILQRDSLFGGLLFSNCDLVELLAHQQTFCDELSLGFYGVPRAVSSIKLLVD